MVSWWKGNSWLWLQTNLTGEKKAPKKAAKKKPQPNNRHTQKTNPHKTPSQPEQHNCIFPCSPELKKQSQVYAHSALQSPGKKEQDVGQKSAAVPRHKDMLQL